MEIKTTKTGMAFIEIDNYPTFNDMNRAYIPSLSLSYAYNPDGARQTAIGCSS